MKCLYFICYIICLSSCGGYIEVKTEDLAGAAGQSSGYYTYEWTKPIAGTTNDWPVSIKVDSTGIIYILGDIQSSNVDFATGFPGSDIQSTAGDNDIFLTKINSDQTYGWTKLFGGVLGDAPMYMDLDTSDNIYFTGKYQSNPTNFEAAFGGTDNKTRIGFDDSYLTRVNSDGSYGWTKVFHQATSAVYAKDIDTKHDALYIVGRMMGTDLNMATDFGATDLVTTLGYDGFVTKVTYEGTYVYTLFMGGTGYDIIEEIEVDSLGDIYLLGEFENAGANFGANFTPPVADVKNSHGGDDLFLTKVNSDGSYGWTKTFGNSSDVSAETMAIDSLDNVYIAGTFTATDLNFAEDFSSSDIKTPIGKDVFVTRINSDGTYGWTKTFGETGDDWVSSLAIDSNGQIFIGGGFNGSNINFGADFSKVDQKSSLGGYDAFITRINTDGKYFNTVVFGSTSEVSIYDLEVTSSAEVYSVGVIRGPTDFGLEFSISDVINNTSGSMDVYIQKLQFHE